MFADFFTLTLVIISLLLLYAHACPDDTGCTTVVWP